MHTYFPPKAPEVAAFYYCCMYARTWTAWPSLAASITHRQLLVANQILAYIILVLILQNVAFRVMCVMHDGHGVTDADLLIGVI